MVRQLAPIRATSCKWRILPEDGGTPRLYGASVPGYCYCMTFAWMVLLGSHLSTVGPTNVSYGFTTEKYAVEMRVAFSAPYEGKRLALYDEAGPVKEICPSISRGVSRCIEDFVGALAVVEFAVKWVADGKPASASIREMVTVVDQSSGLPERPPYAMTITLLNGSGSDLQVFGYDESSLPTSRREAERETAKAAWRRYRQELYLDDDPKPFAVVEWRHTTTRISVLRVYAPLVRLISSR